MGFVGCSGTPHPTWQLPSHQQCLKLGLITVILDMGICVPGEMDEAERGLTRRSRRSVVYPLYEDSWQVWEDRGLSKALNQPQIWWDDHKLQLKSHTGCPTPVSLSYWAVWSFSSHCLPHGATAVQNRNPTQTIPLCCFWRLIVSSAKYMYLKLQICT